MKSVSLQLTIHNITGMMLLSIVHRGNEIGRMKVVK